GTTAALIDATYPMLPGLYDKLPWDVAGDLVPAAMIAQTPFVIVVNAGSKLESLAALISAARARPGKLNFGSAGVGSVIHVVRALAAPDVREKLAAQGAEPSNFTPDEFARFLREDTRRWTEVIRASGIKMEP